MVVGENAKDPGGAFWQVWRLLPLELKAMTNLEGERSLECVVLWYLTLSLVDRKMTPRLTYHAILKRMKMINEKHCAIFGCDVSFLFLSDVTTFQ
jgi:hypothetical protein